MNIFKRKPKCDHKWFARNAHAWEAVRGGHTMTSYSSECVRCGLLTESRLSGEWHESFINNRNGTTNWNGKYGEESNIQ